MTDTLPDIDNLCFTFCIKMWDRGCLAVIQCSNLVSTVYLGKKLLQFVVIKFNSAISYCACKFVETENYLVICQVAMIRKKRLLGLTIWQL